MNRGNTAAEAKDIGKTMEPSRGVNESHCESGVWGNRAENEGAEISHSEEGRARLKGGMGEDRQRFQHQPAKKGFLDLLCPEASPLVLGLSAQRKRKREKGFCDSTSGLAAALPYLHQSQGAAPAPPPPKHRDGQKGPKARNTGRHNKEKV